MRERYSSSLEREDEELGRVRLCRRCGEEWPRDNDFWFLPDPLARVQGFCRACRAEQTALRRARMRQRQPA